jgi:hypothetical protein
MIQLLSSITPLGYASIAMGVLTAIALFRVFFDDLPDFFQCLGLASQPELISILRGEWTDSHWAGMKLMLWVAPSVMSGWVTYSQFPKWWPRLFH